MLSKSHYRSKSTVRRPMSDVSNEGYYSHARVLKKEPNLAVEGKGSLDRLFIVRSDLSDLISQIDNLVAQVVKQKEIPKKGYQEIESFIGFLSGMCSSLKPWSGRLQEALTSTTTVTSKDQIKKHSTPFPLKAKLTNKTNTPQLNVTTSQSLTTPYPYTKTQQSILTSKPSSKQLELLVSPSPLVSWRADHCTVVDGGKQLFLLTPLQKSQLQVSKAMPPTKQLINVQENSTHKKHENIIEASVRITEQGRETGFSQRSKPVTITNTSTMLPDTSTSKTANRHGKDGVSTTGSMSNLRFCSTSKTVVPVIEPVRETVFCGLSESMFPNKPLSKVPDISAGEMDKKHEENGKPVTKPVHDLKVLNQKKEVVDTFDWFFSPPKTCVLMEPSDEKKTELSTPEDKNHGNEDIGEKNLAGTPWNNLHMSVTCTKKGETTLKKELWTRFEAASPGDLRLNADIFQKKDGKGFLDLLDEEASR